MSLLILMTQLMTRIPIPLQVQVREEELGKGNIYFPLIGGVIGVLMAGVYRLASYLYDPQGILIPICVVAAYLWVTGGLHMDGLSDTFDGLWSNRSKERMLEIMKDSRLGAFGALVMFLTILIQVGGFQSLLGQGTSSWKWLILIPVLGRFGAVFGNAISTYARNDGMGKYFIQDYGIKEWLLTTLYVLPLTYWLGGSWGVVAAGIVLICTWFFIRWVHAKIGGITGDVIGAVIELNQLAILLFLSGILEKI